MGTDVFSNGLITDTPDTAILKLVNSQEMAVLLNLTGQHFIETARAVFFSFSKHEDTPPIEYPNSFKLKRVRQGLIRGVRISNTDPTAEWVEFGAHAGGTTPVLKYRVFGRTADILEAEGHL